MSEQPGKHDDTNHQQQQLALRVRQQRQLIRLWLLALAGTDLVYGGVDVAGGAATSPALTLMKNIMPMVVWGVLIIAVAGLLIGRQYFTAGIVGGVMWCTYAITSLMSVIRGTSPSASLPALLFGVTALHLLVTYGARPASIRE